LICQIEANPDEGSQDIHSRTILEHAEIRADARVEIDRLIGQGQANCLQSSAQVAGFGVAPLG
jgi:hypothetical protein